MSEPEMKPELDATIAANESDPPEDSGLEAVSEKKCEEENGVRTVEGEAEGKGEKQDEGAKVVGAEDVKMPEAVDMESQDVNEKEDACGKMVGVEDVKMLEGESIKTAEGKEVKIQEPEDVKMMEGEDINKLEANDVKMQEAEDAKVTETVDVVETRVEDVKMMQTEDTKMLKAEDVKMPAATDEKMAETEDVKDEEERMKGRENGERMEESMEKNEEESTGKEKESRGKEEEAAEKEEEEHVEREEEESKEAKGSKRKRVRGQRVSDVGERKEKKEGEKKEKEALSTPSASSVERPVRERKTVERLVEVLEKEQVKRFVIEKGCGTTLKDIPNVARKLAKKKPTDLKLLHQTLFGRVGKAVDFKNHILQFSGFAWHESEEKQKTKMKEKLDKCVKETLVDLCDLFDLPISKATTRKEELVAVLLDFIAAPRATSASPMFSEKEQQSTKSRKRKMVGIESASKSSGGISAKWSRKKRSKKESTPKAKGKIDFESEEDEEEEDQENGIPEEDEAPKHSEHDEKEIECEEDADDGGNNDEAPKKGKQNSKRSSRRRGSVSALKLKVVSSPKKAVLPSSTKSPSKTSASKQSKADESNDVGARVFSRKKKHVDPPMKKSTPKLDRKEKATGKMAANSKAKSKGSKETGPSKEELRKTICEILNKVDFNTATFTDILKQLASHYNMDLTPRKASIKLIIQEELTKLADEAEENEDDD